jgi:hypothetical protein
MANDWTSDRSHRRSATASAVQSPFLKFPFLLPRGAQGLSPPCKRQRLRPRMAGHWHGEPARVFAPQRAARLRFPSCASTLWFMGLFPNSLLPPSSLSATRRKFSHRDRVTHLRQRLVGRQTGSVQYSGIEPPLRIGHEESGVSMSDFNRSLVG